MKSFFNYLKHSTASTGASQAEPEDLIVDHNFKLYLFKTPFVKFHLEGREKHVTRTLDVLTEKQARAKANRNKLAAQKWVQVKAVHDHAAKVKQQKITNATVDPIKALKPDRKLFAAKSRRTNQQNKKQTKVRKYNYNVQQKVNNFKYQSEKNLENLEERIRMRQKFAALMRGANLLQIRQTA